MARVNFGMIEHYLSIYNANAYDCKLPKLEVKRQCGYNCILSEDNGGFFYRSGLSTRECYEVIYALATMTGISKRGLALTSDYC